MERDRLLWMIVTILAISLQCISNVKCQACPYKKFTPAHTLCLFQGPNTNCSITDRGMSSKEMKLILDHHNSFRSTVAIGGTKHPTASNMKRLYWDTELATIAQRWTDQCIEGHDCNRCRQVGRFLVGQNLLIEEFDNDPYNPKWSEVITTWYKEVKLVKTSDLEDYKFSNLTGDFTQLVWAETNKIGCGYTEFRGSPKNKRVYVCNYGPAGNVQMTGVYTQGDSCSDCERYCSSEYPGLCDSSGKKKARFIRPDRYTLLGSCTSRNVGITCLITNLGEVQWRKMPGRRQGETAQGAAIRPGRSTDLVIQLQTHPPSLPDVCVSFWYQKYPSSNDNSLRNQAAKAFVVTSESSISVMITEDSYQWKKISTTVQMNRAKPTVTVVIHFYLSSLPSSKIRDYLGLKSRSNAVDQFIIMKLDDVQVTTGKCHT